MSPLPTILEEPPLPPPTTPLAPWPKLTTYIIYLSHIIFVILLLITANIHHAPYSHFSFIYLLLVSLPSLIRTSSQLLILYYLPPHRLNPKKGAIYYFVMVGLWAYYTGVWIAELDDEEGWCPGLLNGKSVSGKGSCLRDSVLARVVLVMVICVLASTIALFVFNCIVRHRQNLLIRAAAEERDVRLESTASVGSNVELLDRSQRRGGAPEITGV